MSPQETIPEGKERGVIAFKKIDEGEIIERCPVIIFQREEKEAVEKLIKYKYIFDWEGAVAICCGRLYRESESPNAKYEKDTEKVTMKNGKPARKSKCPTCGTGLYKIGAA